MLAIILTKARSSGLFLWRLLHAFNMCGRVLTFTYPFTTAFLPFIPDNTAQQPQTRMNKKMAIQEVSNNNNTTVRRANEEEKQNQVWRRTKRFFNHEGKWYFQTREGVDVGPYKSFLDAEIEVNILIGKLRGAETTRAIEVIRCHKSSGVSTTGYLNAPEFTSYVVDAEELDSADVELLERLLKSEEQAA